MEILRIVWNYRSTLLLLLLPIVLLPIPIVLDDTAASCGYVIIIMAVYWVFEVLPLAVTSFLPLIMFPLMGIMSAKDTSIVYMKDTAWLIVGGLLIAVAIQHTMLYKRIALGILLAVGSKPHSLMLGFMLTAYFLSMWISNTATTAMMLPIVTGVLNVLRTEELENQKADNEPDNVNVKIAVEIGNEFVTNSFNEDDDENDSEIASVQDEDEGKKTNDEMDSSDSEIEVEPDISNLPEEKQESSKLEKGLTLCIPYAASIGGMATLTGAAPNALLAGQYPQLFPYTDKPITFSNWMAYHLPVSFTIFIFAYIWLMWLYLGLNAKIIVQFCKRHKSESERKVRELLKQEYEKLRKISWSEVTVSVVLATTVVLWFFRDPGFIPGWSSIFEDGYVSDGTVAMTMGTLLFFLPSRKPTFFTRNWSNPDDIVPVAPVLDWPTVNQMFPWRIVLLLGGGFALAEGAKVSGFSEWLGSQLAVFSGIPSWALCLFVTVVVCLFTQCVSNLAATSLFVPIVADLAQATQIHPLYLLLPIVTAANLAYMLPVSSPSNAIAFANEHIEIIDLVKSGSMMCFIGILVLMIFINTYGMTLFDLGEFPDWASENYTTPTESIF